LGTTFSLFLAFALGASISIYHPMNGIISRLTRSPVLTNVVFYFIAFFSSLLMLFFYGGFKQFVRVKDIPPILYITGVMSSIMVLGTIVLIPRLGTRKLFILQVAGQIAMSVAVSNFGLFETPRDPLTLRKALGTIVMLAGAAISVL